AGVRVSILGLTSCLLSQKGNGPGGEEVSGSQVLGLYQLQHLLGTIDAGASFVIALAHHPTSWFVDGATIDNYLDQRCDALLTGHVHDGRLRYSPGPSRLAITHSAGSTYA